MPLDELHPPREDRRWLSAAAVGIWSLLALASWYSLSASGFKTDGVQNSAAESPRWPEGVELAHDGGRMQLVVFLHPKCPCSFATLTELHRVLVSAERERSSLPQVHVVACVPDSEPERTEWQKTRLIQQAKRLPQAELHIDFGGLVAARFGAEASGEVALFDEQGRRVYAGGVTAARGHEGPNVGADSLARLIVGRAGAVAELPALGCRLVSGLTEVCTNTCANLAQGNLIP